MVSEDLSVLSSHGGQECDRGDQLVIEVSRSLVGGHLHWSGEETSHGGLKRRPVDCKQGFSGWQER